MRRSVKDIRLTDDVRCASDHQLFQQFLTLLHSTRPSSILLYFGVGNEPDTSQLFEPLSLLGTELALPRCLPGGEMEARSYRGIEHLTSGPFGIPEPDITCPVVRRDSLSLILVPGLCFDERGFRLGHGGGYYDRYLTGFSGSSVALCRDRLLLPNLPVEPHDRPVDLVLTETRCLSHF